MTDMRHYEGWALITGASSGIGREFARALAAQGVNCILVARRLDRLEALTDELRLQHGVSCQALSSDLTGSGAIQDLVAAVGDTPVSILVNNAGFGHAGLFAERDIARLDEMVRLNCLVPVLLTHAFLPAMLSRGNGAVIMLSSLLGFVPCPYDAVYGATKAFDLSLGQSLWAELRGTGVDVVTLCPGPTKTDFFIVDGLKHDQAKRMEMFAGTPEAMARLALRNLGRKPTTAPALSWLTGFLVRFAPRSWAALAVRAVTSRTYV